MVCFLSFTAGETVKGLNTWGVGVGSLQNVRAQIAISLESEIWQKCGFNTLPYADKGSVRFTVFSDRGRRQEDRCFQALAAVQNEVSCFSLKSGQDRSLKV